MYKPSETESSHCPVRNVNGLLHAGRFIFLILLKVPRHIAHQTQVGAINRVELNLQIKQELA